MIVDESGFAELSKRGLVQIAGFHDLDEAAMVWRQGVRWLGFPLALAVHREDVDPAGAAAVVEGLLRLAAAEPGLPEPLAVLITYLDRAEEIAALSDRIHARAVQLHGDLDPAEAARLRRMRPDLLIIKSLIVRSGDVAPLAAQARAFEPFADLFITDTHDPATGATGATGKTHDWRVSAALAGMLKRPLVLAGGLRPENVRAAVEAVRPWGVDAHTGVEGPDGRKDAALVAAFVAEAKAGFARTPPPAP